MRTGKCLWIPEFWYTSGLLMKCCNKPVWHALGGAADVGMFAEEPCSPDACAS